MPDTRMNEVSPVLQTVVFRTVTLEDGRVVSLFVNKETRLVVLDIVDQDQRGGTEVYRHVLPLAEAPKRAPKQSV